MQKRKGKKRGGRSGPLEGRLLYFMYKRWKQLLKSILNLWKIKESGWENVEIAFQCFRARNLEIVGMSLSKFWENNEIWWNMQNYVSKTSLNRYHSYKRLLFVQVVHLSNLFFSFLFFSFFCYFSFLFFLFFLPKTFGRIPTSLIDVSYFIIGQTIYLCMYIYSLLFA